MIVAISVLHYHTGVRHQYLHEIYQHLYYLPVLLAAFSYGAAGGSLAATLASGMYLYHIQRDWGNSDVYLYSQYAEIVLYYVAAVMIGLLSQRERRHRQRLEAASQELAQTNEKLRHTVEHLEDADRLAALGQLSAGVAHEIRNPLASIKGSVEILENEIPVDHPKREFVEIIRQETARLNSIVGEFLKFARPPRPSFEPASISSLIDSTTLLLQAQAQESRVEIQKTQKGLVPPVALDADQIRQVLLNIMLNGIQAMPDGGALRVHSGMTEDRKAVAIEISDTGKGVDEALVERIFDPFYSTKPHGTGLGLSISYQLVRNHRGRITATRNGTRGMRFRIEIPVTPAAGSGTSLPA